MTKRVLTLWSIGVFVLGISNIAFAQGRGHGNNGNGPNHGNGNGNGNGHDKVKGKGLQTVPVPEIDPAGATQAIALLSGALLVIRGRRR